MGVDPLPCFHEPAREPLVRSRPAGSVGLSAVVIEKAVRRGAPRPRDRAD